MDKSVSERISIVFVTICISVGVAAGGSLNAPSGLLTDGVHNPMCVDSETVSFTWAMNDYAKSSIQRAYQIMVASSPSNIEKSNGDEWNSGEVISSRSAGVEYDGRSLSPGARYWWKVRVWDNHNNVSPWSETAIFDVGLSKSDWTADYIWDGTTNENNFAYFRKSFDITKAVKRAKVYVSANNEYKLYFNGEYVGRGPARSSPNLCVKS